MSKFILESEVKPVEPEVIISFGRDGDQFVISAILPSGRKVRLVDVGPNERGKLVVHRWGGYSRIFEVQEFVEVTPDAGRIVDYYQAGE